MFRRRLEGQGGGWLAVDACLIPGFYSIGFREVSAYCFNPVAGASYMELQLQEEA
jgi:hypothetical protein